MAFQCWIQYSIENIHLHTLSHTHTNKTTTKNGSIHQLMVRMVLLLSIFVVWLFHNSATNFPALMSGVFQTNGMVDVAPCNSRAHKYKTAIKLFNKQRERCETPGDRVEMSVNDRQRERGKEKEKWATPNAEIEIELYSLTPLQWSNYGLRVNEKHGAFNFITIKYTLHKNVINISSTLKRIASTTTTGRGDEWHKNKYPRVPRSFISLRQLHYVKYRTRNKERSISITTFGIKILYSRHIRIGTVIFVSTIDIVLCIAHLCYWAQSKPLNYSNVYTHTNTIRLSA